MAILEQKKTTKVPQSPQLEDAAEKRMSDIVNKNIDANAPETEEERKKREKRERSRKIVSAISDGIRAISNLVFTTKGAPSSYDGSSSLYKSVSEGVEKRKAEREAKQQRYNYWANHAAEREQARNARKMEAYRNQLANAYQERRLQMEEANQNLTMQRYRDEEKRKDAEKKMKNALYESQIRENDAKSNYYNKGGYRGGGSGLQNYTTETQYVRDKDGKLVRQVKSRVVSGTNKTNGAEKNKKVEGRFNKTSNTEGEGGWL